MRLRSMLVVLALLLTVAARSQGLTDDHFGSVTGSVLNGSTKRPVRLARVVLLRIAVQRERREDLQTDDNSFSYTAVTTGLDGMFLFRHVPPGRYALLCTAGGYILPRALVQIGTAKPLGRRGELEAGPNVFVAAGKQSRLDVVLERGAVITGTVTFDDGAPATLAHVDVQWRPLPLSPDKPSVEPFKEHRALEGDNTDDRGRYRIAGLPPGEYIVRATLPLNGGAVVMENEAKDREPLRFYAPNVSREADAQHVPVTGQEEAHDVDIRISLDGLYQIAGHLLAETDGRPLNHASLKLTTAADPQFIRDVETDPDGSYTLDYVPAGSYTLAISNVAETIVVKTKDKDGNNDEKMKALNYFVAQTIPITVLNQDITHLDLKFAVDKTRKPGFMDEATDDKVGETN